MLIIPAIDLKDGQCVRLKQGIMEDATVFSENPETVALHWLDNGARQLHLVDLNGAFAGKPKNGEAIRAIVEAVDGRIPIQLGGGIRDLETIEYYLDNGITYVIIGTAAVKVPGFLHDACYAFPGQIMVGLDAKSGKVAVDGWSKVTGHDVIDLAKKIPGLRRGSNHPYRYRPRWYAQRAQYRSHRGTCSGTDDSCHRQWRCNQSG